MKNFSSSALLLLIIGLVTPLFICISSCHKASPTPCYLHIEPFNITTSYAAQGSTSSKVTDVWVYVNNQNLGAYQLPCNIPVILNNPILNNGKSQIILSAGIMKDGITTMHMQYPFYSSWFDTLTLQEGKTYEMTPKAHYVDSLNFYLKEDFELGSAFNKLLGDTTLVRENKVSNSYEGFYGKLSLDAAHDTVEIISTSSWSLPENTSPVFIEMNYKCDYEFTVGLLSTTSSTATKYWHETFIAKSGWNKVYIDITDAVNELKGTSYQIIIKAGNTYGHITSPTNFYFDNIKLISRK